MSRRQAEDPPQESRTRWWLAWTVIAAVVLGGAIAVLRLGPRLVPVLETLR
ncbi:MAG: hypothetical protein IT361_12915 [Gemmatimonadaceae bacterium]|nr:hypothetical protein [Gemmatimonadaceae bacterium]